MIKNALVAILLSSLPGLPPGLQQPQKPPPPPQWPVKESRVELPPLPADDDDVVRITTSLVQLDAVVTKDGAQVTDLKAEDFEIFEDGRAQTITNFSYFSNVPAASSSPSSIAALPPVKGKKNRSAPPVLPAVVRPQDTRRTIAVVVDDLGISMESMGSVKSHLRKFVDQEIQPNDLVAIIHTGGEVGALQQFTNDKRLLYRAIEGLRRNPCSRMGVTVLAAVDGNTDNGKRLCSAESLSGTIQALQFIVQGMRQLPGRKSMVILSDEIPLDTIDLYSLERGPIAAPRTVADSEAGRMISAPRGFLYSNEVALRRIAELANRASVVIYAIDTSGIQVTGITAADNFSAGPLGIGSTGVQGIISRSEATIADRRHRLQDNRAGADAIARETGGFLIHGTNDFGLTRVMRDQEGYYLIAYRPKPTTFNRSFHHIKARVKRPGLTVRMREGFFGVPDEQTQPVELTNRDRMNIALMSPFGAVEIDVRLTALFANVPDTGSLLRSLLYFQARDLTFTNEPDGWHQATFNLSGIIFGDNGRVVNQVSETRTLRLKNEDYDRALREGIVYQLDMPIKNPGAYQFRVAVRDATSLRIGTAGQFVEVPDLKNVLALSGITVSTDTAANPPEMTGNSGTTRSPGDQGTLGVSMANPANRRFRQGSNLYFGYAVYKAQLDKATQLPNLTAQAKLFRDGKLVYEGGLKPIDISGQTDLERITEGGGLQLGKLPPGEYVLQLFVNDALVQGKNRTATQWIDFDIVQ
jgi:VWFA-related protein